MTGESQQTPESHADPTVLTTEQLERAIGNQEKLTNARLKGLEEHIDARFSSIERHLDQVERQRVEQKTDTKAAVDAALIAQKEAVKEQTTASERAIAKSEAATSKQLEQLTTTFTTAISGVTGILNDVKERVGKIESMKQGATETKASATTNANLAIGALSLIVAVLTVAVVVILANA